ncbi:MAG: hypothetical protein FWD92_03960 [Methanomassiliicoccaceae archaeon]|nr:hypothetical protein [Methanomassiliicoccaceae archaeon]
MENTSDISIFARLAATLKKDPSEGTSDPVPLVPVGPSFHDLSKDEQAIIIAEQRRHRQ